MIVLRSPKGWTCPFQIDGHQTEGSWRAHQVPIKDVAQHPEDLRLLEALAEELPSRPTVP